MSDECHVCDELDEELRAYKKMLLFARNRLAEAVNIIDDEDYSDEDYIIVSRDFIEKLDKLLTEGETK